MLSPETKAEWQSSFRALAHRDFRLYMIGQAVSLTGTWMQGVAQSWLVYRLTHSEAMLGVTLFATHAPVLFLGPLGGMVADRLPRRGIVFFTQLFALIQALTLAWLTHTNQVTTAHVIALSVMLGIINSFDIPGRQSLFVQMVGREDLISAISLNSAVFNFSRVFGPSLGGLLVAIMGESFCFLLNATSFVAMLVCLARMRIPAASKAGHQTAPSGFWDGFRYAWERREVAIVLAMSGLLNLACAPVLALGPFFADGIFHQGSAGLGFLGGAMGFGAVIGVLRLARHRGIAQLPHVILWSSLVMGVALAAFAFSQWFVFSLLMMPAIGFALMRQNAGGNSLLQTTVPDEFRGRLMALYTMVVTGLMPLGSLASGMLAERYGPRTVVAAGALLCLAGAMAFHIALPCMERWVARQEEEICVIS
ncbi:MAG: MFS transporter [Bryobacterales bacterium]|nr:MFS transporter [Bryobacterales bacterium]